MGYTGNSVNGTYGFDTVGISQVSSPDVVPVARQVVADIITEEFYVGTLGLNAAPINFSTTDSTDSAVSLLTSLKNQNSIPSRSFGFTAGAAYRGNGVNASLTLGGYDASRFTPNDVSFTFAPAKTRQLVASVQSITYSDSKSRQPLMDGGILALVDSTVPYLWLPKQACQAFEKAFGITWDPIANLYLINDTTHSTLIKTNPSVIFEISNSLTAGPSVNITLPYASFDLNASYPLVKNQQRYFPLQVAADENSYTLGRTFFQEAFIVVNYENSTFSLSQAVYDTKTPSHILAIAPSYGGSGTAPGPPSSPTLTPVSNGGSGGIGSGAIAGIVVAFILAAIIAILVFFLLRRRHRKSREVAELPSEGAVNGKESPMSDLKGSLLSQDTTPPKNASVPAVNISEVPMIPPMSPIMSGTGINEYYRPSSPGSPSKPIELAGDKPPRSELSSPERPSSPVVPSELPSPDPQAIRSELSTPEPLYPEQELPTPDPSHELRAEKSVKGRPDSDANRSSQALPSSRLVSQATMSTALVSPNLVAPAMLPEAMPSPAISAPPDRLAGDSDADSDHLRSALESPRLPLQRPSSLRVDSSDSEALFTRDGLPRRTFSAGGASYRRQNSSSSDLPTTSNFAPRRPPFRRNDTGSSGQSDVSQMGPATGAAPRPQLARMFPSGSASFIAVRPPHNRGLSQDSDTWETRLEMSSADEGKGGSGERKRRRKTAGSAITKQGLQSDSKAAVEDPVKDSSKIMVPEADPSTNKRPTSESQMVSGFATRDTSASQQQQRGHRRAVTAEEQKVREGLVGGGVLRQSQTETGEMEEPGDLLAGEPVSSGALQETEE